MSGMEKIVQYSSAKSAEKTYAVSAKEQDIRYAKEKNGKITTCMKKAIAEHVAFRTSLKSQRAITAERRFAEHAYGKGTYAMKTKNHRPQKN